MTGLKLLVVSICKEPLTTPEPDDEDMLPLTMALIAPGSAFCCSCWASLLAAAAAAASACCWEVINSLLFC